MKLIILDRDGVINYDSCAYIKSPAEWIPIPGSIEAISILKAAGWIVTVATNQSGLAQGLFDLQTLQLIHAKLLNCLAEYHASVDYIVWCPHGPNDHCTCRKPAPGLYLQVAQHFDCPLKNVPVIGDSLRDLVAATSVGASPMLVTTGKGAITLSECELPAGTRIFPDLYTAVLSLL